MRKKGGQILLVACQSASEHKNTIWFLDSACSNHMTIDEKMFLDMDASVTSQVKMGNGALVQVKGKGTIKVQTNVGTKFIQDVLLVLDLKQNLLSIGQLLEHR